jgi:hypothetical protein
MLAYIWLEGMLACKVKGVCVINRAMTAHPVIAMVIT